MDRGEALDASASRLISLLWRPECRGPYGDLNQSCHTKAPHNHPWLLRITDYWPVNLAGDFSRLCGSLLYTPCTVDTFSL